MVPPLGKITSFFRPYTKKNAEPHYDCDNITVARRREPSEEVPRASTPKLGSLKRSISPRPSSKKSSRSKSGTKATHLALPAGKAAAQSQSRASKSQAVVQSQARASKSQAAVQSQSRASQSQAAVQSQSRASKSQTTPLPGHHDVLSRLDSPLSELTRPPTAPILRPAAKDVPPAAIRTEKQVTPQRPAADNLCSLPDSPLTELTKSPSAPVVRLAKHTPPAVSQYEKQATPKPPTRDNLLSHHDSPLTELTRSPSTPLVVRRVNEAAIHKCPAAARPAILQSAVSQSAVSQPAASQSAASQPAASQPAVAQLAASQSAASQSATSQPATSQSAASQPAASQPAASQPAASSNAVTASFSSTSSRRVVVNGVKVVTNSDSDSVSSSSEDELLDIASFMPRKRLKMTPPGSDPANAIELLDDDETPKPRPNMARRDRRRIPAAAQKKPYRHSLLKLVQQVEKDEASTLRIKQAEADVDERPASDSEHDKNKSRAGLLEDNGDQERVKAAIDRVEAFEEFNMFYFFHGQNTDQPASSPTWETLAPLMHTQFGKDIVISSRFLTDLASQVDLPPEVLTWVYRALQVEPSEMLCDEYLSILQTASRHGSSPSRIGCRPLREVYQISLDKRCTASAGLPRNLRQNLRLLASLTGAMTTSERAVSLTDLFLTNVDEHVRSSIDMQLEVGNTMQAVLDSSTEEAVQPAIDQILSCALLTKQQMAHGIACLPATTAALHRFRRRLALHYLLAKSAKDVIDCARLETGQQLLTTLTRLPIFSITQDTSWTMFHCIVHILDICIDAGFSDFTFMASDSSIETQDEKNFNTQIDEISRRLRVIANSIRDSGTSHLRRTEAKSALERLVLRIELSVRTRSKRKAAVFGGRVSVGQQSNLKNFLTNAESGDDEDMSFQSFKPEPGSAKGVQVEDKLDVLLKQME